MRRNALAGQQGSKNEHCPLKRKKKGNIKTQLMNKLLKLIVLLKPNMHVTTKIDFF